MANTITNRQMIFILFLSLTSVSIVDMPKVMAESAGSGSWTTLLLTAAIVGVLAAVIARLNHAFSGMILYDYSRELMGRAVAVIFAIFYILYFFIVLMYLNTFMAGMLKANFLFKTPPWAFFLTGIPVFGYMVFKGFSSVARMFELYGIACFVTMFAVHIIMFIQGNVRDILPLFNPSEVGTYLAAIPDAFIAFLGIEVLTVMPFSKKNKKAPRVAFLTLLGIGLVYVLIVESSIMMISPHEVKYYNYPLITAIRQIVLHSIEFLRRLDILYLTMGLAGIFVSISASYLAIVEYISRLFPKAGRGVVVSIVGVVLFLLSWAASGIPSFSQLSGDIICYSGLVTAGGIPVVLWVIAKVKKRA